MNLALSNLAWDDDNFQEIEKVLEKCNISNIECVLTKIKKWNDLSIEDILYFKNMLYSKNLTPYSIQSLFFDTDIFDFQNQDKMINHFIRIIEYSKILDIKVLVLGSPKIRKKYDNYLQDVSNFFKKIDNLLSNTNIVLVIEPNSKKYSAEFFNTIDEIILFLKENNFENVKTMIDTHNLFLEGANPTEKIKEFKDFIYHIHISENELKPMIKNNFHSEFSETLRKINYQHIITYEVIKTKNLIQSINDFYEIYK